MLEAAAGRSVILTRAPGYLLDADPESIDARRFQRLIEDGSRALGEGEHGRAGAALGAAIDLWRGQPLADFAYEDFAQGEIRRLQDLRLTAIEGLAQARLIGGHASEVLSMVDRAIDEDPLRERLREVQMVALYRAGRHHDALRAYQDYRRTLADELGLDPSPALQRLQERILLHDPSLEIEEQPADEGAIRNPYKGLRPFSEEDAGDFFGRAALVQRLLRAVGDGAPLLAAVGPSGSGKSSVVAAGLIPALRAGAIEGSERWVIAQMQPGTNPADELRAAVRRALDRSDASAGVVGVEVPDLSLAATARALPPGSRLLLVIDQFEDLFTIDDEQVGERFLRVLASAVAEPESPVQVVICLRGDFYDRPLLHPEFAAVFVPGVVNVLPMTPAEIEEAVVEPARRTSVEVQRALLAEVTADSVNQPGALPLLQYALTELFEQRAGASLTLEAYRGIGGIRGALSRRAEEVCSRASILVGKRSPSRSSFGSSGSTNGEHRSGAG